ncbi:hypothetical protein BJ508DRAFT_410355 [Ascobolus immersus RN42]|uniref:Uncharacterized protein n=1 Tax=Ascobolus immersus RN42 TaxID=1160509 RepID=A0A3N4IN87_ASCIM|nr:hypothetical protein BJ508DRAFT_410355 [Ascobolus immersus RN42]
MATALPHRFPRQRHNDHSDSESIDGHSTTSNSSYDDSSDDEADAEEEWQESLRQLELFANIVLMPLVGKWVGRRCAYWIWGRVMEWKFPRLEMVFDSKNTFRASGLLEAASSTAAGSL